jgi:hypothetical protein
MAAECYGLFSDDNSHQVGAAPAIYNSSLCIDYFSGKEALTKVRDYDSLANHEGRRKSQNRLQQAADGAGGQNPGRPEIPAQHPVLFPCNEGQ